MTTKPNASSRMSDATLKALADAGVAGNVPAAQAYGAEIVARSGGRYDHLNSPQAIAGLRQWQAEREQHATQAAAAGILAAGKPQGSVN